MESLENRIITVRNDDLIRALDDAWGTTEGFRPSECVFERSIAKSSTRVILLCVALISVVIYSIVVAVIERGTSFSWLTRVTFGFVFLAVSFSSSWSLCWPYPSRHSCWQTAVDFVEAIRHAEEMTGQPFEEWKNLVDVKSLVIGGLANNLEPVKEGLKDPWAGSRPVTFLNQWRKQRLQMSKLFPSIPEEESFFKECGIEVDSSEMRIDG